MKQITVTVTPTPEALAFWNASNELIVNLACRWKDEHKFENINDYMIPLKPIAARCSVNLEYMIKKPFGCQFSVGPKVFVIEVRKTISRYRRVA